MRTAAICPTCATYENAVCVIYNGPTLSNINVPPLTDLQTALGSINASIGSVIALINSVAANPISLTTTGTSGPATLTGNALNVPNYQPTFQNVITNGNQLTSGLVFSTTGNTNIATVNNTNLTANRNYELPDTAGTLALASDITLQNVTAGTNKNLTNGINLQGTGAGDNNTGTQDINAFGLDAAKNNSGVIVNAFGRRAAENNTGNNVVAFGIDSASDNTGDYVNSIGSTCLTNNTGSYVNAIGLGSGNNNSYSYINLFGFGATASANNQVVFSKDAGGQVARIGYGGITADRLYALPDASGTIALTNTAWSLTGNASTNPSTDFIGTTDNQDIVFKRNSTEYLRFKTTGANDDVYFSKNIKLQGTTPQIWLNGSLGYSVISTDSTGGFITLNNNNSHSATIKAANLTTDRTLQLPDANGTLAIEDYKVYTAVISQTGTGAPTVDYTLKNTLGFTPTFAYGGVGSYTIQSPSFNWTASKVVVFVNPGYQATAHTIGWERNSSTFLTLYTVNSTNNTFTNSLLNKASIEIRVYS